MRRLPSLLTDALDCRVARRVAGSSISQPSKPEGTVPASRSQRAMERSCEDGGRETAASPASLMCEASTARPLRLAEASIDTSSLSVRTMPQARSHACRCHSRLTSTAKTTLASAPSIALATRPSSPPQQLSTHRQQNEPSGPQRMRKQGGHEWMWVAAEVAPRSLASRRTLTLRCSPLRHSTARGPYKPAAFKSAGVALRISWNSQPPSVGEGLKIMTGWGAVWSSASSQTRSSLASASPLSPTKTFL
mmetsp:Transcript_51301/g.102107  ORF Transcript_51301/g.102107 Transcript_51301/m.102107 type:complete len:249 (+) Transcript_51301:820-1566(+)